MTARILFWTAVLLLFYSHAGYALLIRIWARLRPKPWRAADPRHGSSAPSVSIVVVAHNEEARIEARLLNFLALDYPSDRLEILVGSDGSTDRTVERARAFEERGIRVFPFAARRGKPAALNDLIAECRGEIVVLADARQPFDAAAVRALTAPFADPRVGAVSGELVFVREEDETTVGEGVGRYWQYETAIRLAESQVDSTIGATGAIYAIRRALFEPIPPDTILDDVLIPMRIARRGSRVLFEPRARACDRPAATERQEQTRKIRTLAGNFQLFARETWLLNPLANRLWLQVVSHKGLRLLGPILLPVAFASSLALAIAGRPFFALALLAQLAFYAAALAGAVAARRGGKRSLLAVPYIVCLFHWATAVALARVFAGRQRVTWDAAR